MDLTRAIDFTGRTILVTGAGGGIGLAVLSVLQSVGATLVAVDQRPPPEEFGTDPEWHQCDVAEPGALAAIARTSQKMKAGLDGFVLCAGLFPQASLSEMTSDEWRQVHAVNLDSAFYAFSELGPCLRNGAAAVAVASIAAHRGSFHHAHYASSKAGLIALVKSAALELGGREITANCVSPGPVDTPMVKPLMDARGETILRDTPLRRIATPADVAHAVAFLCSDWAKFITGQVLHVNGGQYMAG